LSLVLTRNKLVPTFILSKLIAAWRITIPFPDLLIQLPFASTAVVIAGDCGSC
jgi:hypothetical protein